MFTKRISRRVYWIGVGVLAGIAAVTMALPGDSSPGGAISLLWILLWVPRLRDAGKVPWIAALPILAQVLFVVASFVFGGDTFGKVLTGDTLGIPDEDPGMRAALIVFGSVILIHVAFTVWVGVLTPDPGANRYGEPPKW